MIPLPRAVTLSVIIPCYNEEATISLCLERVLAIAGEDLALEIIVVDDCSTDNSPLILTEIAGNNPAITLLRHTVNQGKGAAIRTGISHATKEFVVIQDADLEYDPRDLRRMLIYLAEDKADVVFGSRFITSEARRVLYFWHYVANTFLTLLSNVFSNLNLSDMETCYKMFRREVIQSITIEEDRFGFEPEIVAKIAHIRPLLRIYEIGISYYGRTYAEGKKIGWRDGVRALYCILKYNLSR